ncbi:hypothetical protein DSL72_006727 [Monilinia vaccinii-corymbosi]|uniref:3-beta hydroxysteroid dehydrogenase/isomerase domain-containing protein n=1 Tax=Monilinia vaccinii-corymbosi TaxID=61207 RepID=A0A8A3PPL2_9HELO|nr:hypothetical protein DSL72_006727 [Monilinia vaccinii-corymbosi]
MQGQPLGNALVVGGCGFMGHHLVKALLDDPTTDKVSVFSRNPKENRYPGATYYAGDITSFDNVSILLEKVKPCVIFHVASPDPYADPPSHAPFQKVNVDGTANLLTCASAAPSVVAFIFTSSLTVYPYDKNGEIFNADETHPVLSGPVTSKNPYPESKSVADAMVRAANNPPSRECQIDGCSHSHLRTACMRIPGIYGEGDENVTLLGLWMASWGLWIFQLGDNVTLYDPIYVGNAVFGHILAAKALLSEESSSGETPDKASGEAFNITDDKPSPFWWYMHKFYRFGGYNVTPRNTWVVPTWLIMMVGWIAEWAYWFMFLGKRRPQILMRSKLEHLCKTRTFDVGKAKRVLGWKRKIEVDDAIESSVRWALAELAKGSGSGKVKVEGVENVGEVIEVGSLNGKFRN